MDILKVIFIISITISPVLFYIIGYFIGIKYRKPVEFKQKTICRDLEKMIRYNRKQVSELLMNGEVNKAISTQGFISGIKRTLDMIGWKYEDND